MPVPDVEIRKKIAKHPVHVERAITKIKKCKIVSGRILKSMFRKYKSDMVCGVDVV